MRIFLVGMMGSGKSTVGKKLAESLLVDFHDLDKIIEAIDNLNPFDENRDIFATSVAANSHKLNFDSEGRVTMVHKLLKHANINSKVLFVGQGKTFQMWDPSNFKRFSLSAQKKANLKRAELKWKSEN